MSNKEEDSVHAWLSAYDKSKPRIWVEAPELSKTKYKGLISKSITTYNVVVVGGLTVFNVGGVRKRYSEFEALRKTLESHYGPQGMLIPTLPPKRVVGNQSQQFVKSRMRGLSLFVKALSHNPFIMHDSAFERFLLSMSDSSMESLNEPAGGSSSSNNMGREKWMDYLATLRVPTDAEYQLQRVKIELEVAERNLKDVLEAGSVMSHGLTAFSKSLSGLSHVMHQFEFGENDLCILNDLHPEPQNSVPTLAAKTAEFATETCHSFCRSPEHMDLLFSEIIEYEISQIHALRELLRARDELANVTIQKTQKKLYSLQCLPAEKQQKNRSEIEALQMKLATEEERCEDFTKTLIWYTIPLAARERNAQLNKAMSHLASIMASSTCGAYTASLKYLSSLHLNPFDIVAEANEITTRLLIHPVKDIGVIRPLGVASAVETKAFPQARFLSSKVTSNNNFPVHTNTTYMRTHSAPARNLWDDDLDDDGDGDSFKV